MPIRCADEDKSKVDAGDKIEERMSNEDSRGHEILLSAPEDTPLDSRPTITPEQEFILHKEVHIQCHPTIYLLLFFSTD